MAGSLIGFPSANIAPTATPSWPIGNPVSGYPATNMLTLVPGDVAKVAETTASARLTFGGSVTPLFLMWIHTNWGGASSVTLSNNGGMTPQAITVRESEDGLCECAFVDLRGVANVAATQFTVAVVGADGPVALGVWLAYDEVFEPHTRWEYLTGARMPKVKMTAASGAMDFVFSRPTRRRKFRGNWHWAEDRPLWRRLFHEAYSVNPTPFGFVPDLDDSECGLYQLVDDEYNEGNTFFDGAFRDNSQSGIVETQVELLEVGAGAPLP
jgi:hypothetical protein